MGSDTERPCYIFALRLTTIHLRLLVRHDNAGRCRRGGLVSGVALAVKIIRIEGVVAEN